jgi:hypothetical protein
MLVGIVKHTNMSMHRESKQVEANCLSNKMHKYHPLIQDDPFEMSQKETKTLQKRIHFIMWYGNMLRYRRTILWHVVYGTFFSTDKRRSDFHGLWIMACRMSSSLFLSRILPPVWGIVRPFSRNMLYHFTMSQCEGTWWQLYWCRKACWVLVTPKNFPYHTTHCARRFDVTAIFVSHALALPRGHVAEPPVNPPFTLHEHPSRSYSNKLHRDTYINFLYTTVYFSNISNGSLCIILGVYVDHTVD